MGLLGLSHSICCIFGVKDAVDLIIYGKTKPRIQFESIFKPRATHLLSSNLSMLQQSNNVVLIYDVTLIFIGQTFCCVQVEKGKLHGCIDVGLSVMAIKKKAKCIDLDAEENIYHLKVSQQL